MNLSGSLQGSQDGFPAIKLIEWRVFGSMVGTVMKLIYFHYQRKPEDIPIPIILFKRRLYKLLYKEMKLSFSVIILLAAEWDGTQYVWTRSRKPVKNNLMPPQ